MLTSPSDPTVFQRRESEARSYCRGFDAVFSQAAGSELIDADGNRYIDFLAGCSSLNYGHNDPDMKQALIDHIDADGIAHGLDLHTETKARFLTAFETHILKPRNMDHRVMFTGPTGANAVEAAMKLARKVTKRTNIISFTNGFHGRAGSFFSFEEFGVTPDIVTMAKSISGFGLPMALMLVRPEHDKFGPAEHNGTFRGNTHAFVTARIAIEKFWADDSFQEQLKQKERIILSGLAAISEMVPGARLKGRGLMRGVDVGSGDLAAAICRRAYDNGLVIETSGPNDEVVKILAPLTTPDTVLRKGLNILMDAVRDTTTDMKFAAE
jgi:4-aminobutyrate aminotransferase-like enzyme